MDCKITSTKRRRCGSTLTEMMVVGAVTVLLGTVLAMLYLYANRSFASIGNYMDMNAQSRMALDRIGREIRQADAVSSHAPERLTLRFGTNIVQFVYDGTAETLSRVGGGTTETLLTGCDFLKFDIYQRNPKDGVYDLYPTATPLTCKVVEMTWQCSRNIFGHKANTATIQSAKVVIRKQKL